jgi:thioesterase domain-containing protein/acyl carrier protein
LKVRGYSVELSEIESALAAVDGIAQSAAAAWHDEHGETRLAAYVVIRDAEPLSPMRIRTSLAQRLPHYMLPSRIVLLEQLPLLPSGKVDRGALQSMPARIEVGREPTAPATRTERTVARAWETELGCALTDVHTEFADLGGDSADAVTVCLRLSKVYGVDIQPLDLYQAPTVAALSARVDELSRAQSAAERTSPLVALRSDGRRPPWFLVPGAGGDVHVAFSYYGRIARHLDSDQPLYALIARGTRGEAYSSEDVEQMAADYLSELKQVQPAGPYHLVGGCLGGSVAFEMAQQLHAAGEKVGALVLLDAPYPETISASSRARALRANAHFLDKLIQRLTHHRQALRRMTPVTAVSYLWRKVRMFPRFYLMTTYRWARHHPDVRKARRIEQAIRGRRGHIAAYRPRPYAGKVTVITSEAWWDQECTRRWERVAAGGVEFRVTPGGHESQLLDHADKVAAILAARVRSQPQRGGQDRD